MSFQMWQLFDRDMEQIIVKPVFVKSLLIKEKERLLKKDPERNLDIQEVKVK
jgi:hypothetical protein